MFIAKELRKKNPAEYLLYMWQIEDMIRAMGCSLPLIRKAYINHFVDYTEEQKEEEADWFGHLVRMMNEEGKRESGHLNINDILLKDMVDLHQRLLQSSKFPFYNAEYYKVLPFIVELRARNKRAEHEADGLKMASDYEKGEIETCFDALYGIMVLRLQQKEISPDTQHAMKEITTFIGMLSDYYLKDETEGQKFEDE